MTSKASAFIVVLAIAGGAFYGAPEIWPELKPKRDALVASLPPEIAKHIPGIKPAGEAGEKTAAAAPAQNRGGTGGGPGGGGPGGPGGARPPVPVALGKAQRQPMPVRFDTIGTVQTVATVVLRSRVESQVLSVGFEDGATVQKGDILFQLDSRGIEAQIKQAEANLVRSKAQLEQAQRDVKRGEQLIASDVGSRVTVDNARTAVQTTTAQIRADEAVLENLNVQLSYYTIRAPITGKVGVAGIKPGNIAKTGDGSPALATINQIDPIYVSFSVPQRLLPELREALAKGTAKVQATPQGLTDAVDGRVAVIDNAVDAATGTILLRGIFDNGAEVLWPGALCDVRLVIRTEPDAITVPREAVQTSQNGQIVFVVENGTARAQPVTVDRSLRGLSVIKSGLKGDETVVTDGQLLLTNGARVEARQGGGGQRPNQPGGNQPGGNQPGAPGGGQRPPAPAGASVDGAGKPAEKGAS